jgi:thiol-disulfide isomerase/thioredoxin
VLFNHGDEDLKVEVGDRVAQLILELIAIAVVEEVDELDDTTRGAGGFGSTGVNKKIKTHANQQASNAPTAKLDATAAASESKTQAPNAESKTAAVAVSPVAAITGTVLGKDEKELTLPTTGLIGLYFSADWCAPCRKVTPKLSAFYKAVREQKLPLEIVFVSQDLKESAFTKYWGHMPWPAVQFQQSKAGKTFRTGLKKKYHPKGIPGLVVFRADTGAIVSQSYKDVLHKTLTPAEVFANWVAGRSGSELSKPE